MNHCVGDEVMVRDDLHIGKEYGYYHVNKDMAQNYRGRVGVIAKADRHGYKITGFDWYWTDEMLVSTIPLPPQYSPDEILNLFGL